MACALMRVCSVPLYRDMVRVGRPEGAHVGLREFTPGTAECPAASVASLTDLMHSAKVVGCTCLAANHGLLGGLTFDVCFVDEASQITLPAVLGPLLRARSFVLVGDHNQLPPLVQNKQAIEGGLGIPLFKTLCDTHPGETQDVGLPLMPQFGSRVYAMTAGPSTPVAESVAMLSAQYRMNAEILSLSNELVYSGRLRCGSAEVAAGRLQLGPMPLALDSTPLWLARASDPELPVAFVDTSPAGEAFWWVPCLLARRP